MTAIEALRASPLFKDFTDTGLQILASVASARQASANTPLFVENMSGDALLVIAEGRVGLTVKGRQNEDVFLGELGPGDSLGELSLITVGQRQCTAMAATPVTYFEIRQGDFHKLMGTKPQACIKLLMAIVTSFGAKLVENKDALKSLVVKP